MKPHDPQWQKCHECGWDFGSRDIITFTADDGVIIKCCRICFDAFSKMITDYKIKKETDSGWEKA